MTSNIKVRTKLLVVLIPLAVGVIIAVGLVVVDRLSLADDYSDDIELIELASAQADFASSVATESVYAVIGSEGDEFAITEFEASAEIVNDAWNQFALVAWPNVDGRDELLDAQVATLGDEFTGRIAQLRSEVLAGTAHPDVVQSGYEALDDALAGVEEATIGNAHQVEALSGLNTSSQLSEVLRSLSDIARTAAVSAALDPTGEGPADLGEQLGAYRQSNSKLLSVAENGLDARYETAIASIDDNELTTALNGGTKRDVLDSGVGDGESLLPLSAALAGLQQDLLDEADTEIEGLHQNTTEDVRTFAIMALLGLLAAIALSVLVARSISQPLKRLNTRAAKLASEDLPKLIEQLEKSGSSEPFEDYSLPADSTDELGELAGSINSIAELTIDSSASQSEILRTNIKDIFVHLARRNIGLLDRQIAVIDELEQSETIPEQLDEVLQLDHLATRLRRNAESLLVIAGVETPRRQDTSIGLVEVLRVATGEVEDRSRIELTSVDPVEISGDVAVDLAHLLSELLENATQFSTADTKVEIRAGRGEGNGFKITIADRGIGMVAEQCAAANELLANPTLMGSALHRSLGFTVISHLAARIDSKVTLLSKKGTGTVAAVLVPLTAIWTAEQAEGNADAGPKIAHKPDRAPIETYFEREEAEPPTIASALAELEPLIAATDPISQPVDSHPELDSALPVAADAAASPATDIPAKPLATRRAAPTPFSASGSNPQDQQPVAIPVEEMGEEPALQSADDRSTRPVELTGDSVVQPRPGFKELAEFAHAQDVADSEDGEKRPKPGEDGVIQATGGTTTLTSDGNDRSVAPTKRSPEEVRRLLSRYRGGHKKGPTKPSHVDEQNNGVQDQ